MRDFLQAAARGVRRWSAMLAAALVLVHAAPSLACGSSGAASGCCGDCDPKSCLVILSSACVDNQPTCSMGLARMHAPAADRSGNGPGPDLGHVTSDAAPLNVSPDAGCSSSPAPRSGSPPRLYLLLRQLRL